MAVAVDPGDGRWHSIKVSCVLGVSSVLELLVCFLLPASSFGKELFLLQRCRVLVSMLQVNLFSRGFKKGRVCFQLICQKTRR